MSNEIAVKAPANIQFIAGTPAEMEAAQDGLIAWCKGKIASVQTEYREAKAAVESAANAGLATARFKRQVAKHRRRILFYTKVQAALEAGYYIVPPFPVQIFAIRTKAKSPKRKTSNNRFSTHHQDPQSLEAGEGRYVSPLPEVWDRPYEITDKDGKIITKHRYYAKEFRDVDFPFSLVKPEILEVTGRTLKAKIFDQLGVLPQFGCGDPIVVGQIKHPISTREPLTFFVAWWLDTKDI